MDNQQNENGTPVAVDKATSSKKKLLITGAILAVLILAGGFVAYAVMKNSEPTSTKDSTATTSSEAQEEESDDDSEATTASGLSVAVNDTCGLTEQVTQGPYYITGTNKLSGNNLNYDNLSGTKVKIEGYVYAGASGSKPIANAKIEVWQADDAGDYHPASNGAASSYSASQLSLRGYVTTDSNGYYYYYTIYPGQYTGRTRHIHTNTTASGYTGVITQIIVPSKDGDETTIATDGIAQSLPKCNQVTFTDVDGVPTAAYNYRLQ
ncbi:MAG: hypothetical protein U0520_04810 [Candidatus Saccharimonadales bacterium]